MGSTQSEGDNTTAQGQLKSCLQQYLVSTYYLLPARCLDLPLNFIFTDLFLIAKIVKANGKNGSVTLQMRRKKLSVPIGGLQIPLPGGNHLDIRTSHLSRLCTNTHTAHGLACRHCLVNVFLNEVPHLTPPPPHVSWAGAPQPNSFFFP